MIFDIVFDEIVWENEVEILILFTFIESEIFCWWHEANLNQTKLFDVPEKFTGTLTFWTQGFEFSAVKN